MISHADYSYLTQDKVDEVAREIGVSRPERLVFNSQQELVETIAKEKHQEGVCLYYNNDQNIVKIKSEWYLSLHRLKSEMSGIKNLLDFWFSINCPNYDGFMQAIEAFDDDMPEEEVRTRVAELIRGKGNNKMRGVLKDNRSRAKVDELVGRKRKKGKRNEQ